MKFPKRHAPTVFLVVMVFFMVLAMTLVLTLFNHGTGPGLWWAWGRNFLVAYPAALPIAYVSRIVANRIVARVTA